MEDEGESHSSGTEDNSARQMRLTNAMRRGVICHGHTGTKHTISKSGLYDVM